MVAIALPDVDRRKLERIRDRLTPLTALDLSEIELPGLERVGRRAERTVDRLTGRSRTSIWPRLALGLGLLAVIGLAVVVFGSSRRSARGTTTDDGVADPLEAEAQSGGGLTAAETSLMSTDPAEEAL